MECGALSIGRVLIQVSTQSQELKQLLAESARLEGKRSNRWRGTEKRPASASKKAEFLRWKRRLYYMGKQVTEIGF